MLWSAEGGIIFYIFFNSSLAFYFVYGIIASVTLLTGVLYVYLFSNFY